MQAFLQTLHEQYRTEYYGPWHTRECYPWEYDVKAQECIQLASKSDPQFFLPQAKILQDRAAYIRQEWARQEALQAKQTATQPAHQSTQSSTQPATQPEHSVKQEEEQSSTENITETVSSSSDTTALLSTVSHQSTQSKQEEETLQQANAEDTVEKPSGNKSTIVKNTAHLSTIPRQPTIQQADNDTTIWPAISACLGNTTLWYITAMTTQEEDLLRRSQPIGPLQEEDRKEDRTVHIWTN